MIIISLFLLAIIIITTIVISNQVKGKILANVYIGDVDVGFKSKEEFEENNGIVRLIDSLKGHRLFGMVELIKTERSETADIASLI